MDYPSTERSHLQGSLRDLQKRHPRLFNQQEPSLPRLRKSLFPFPSHLLSHVQRNSSHILSFQARMESLPGEVEAPSWQKAINWESAGAFRVRWLVICTTRFQRIGHLKNPYNDHQAVLIGKDGQEIEEGCGRALVECIDEEVEQEVQSERFADAGGGYWGS
jgi:hypothetical protein